MWLVVLAGYRDSAVLLASVAAAVVSHVAVAVLVATPELGIAATSHLVEHAVWLAVETACLTTFIRVRVQATVRTRSNVNVLGGERNRRIFPAVAGIADDDRQAVERLRELVRKLKQQVVKDKARSLGLGIIGPWLGAGDAGKRICCPWPDRCPRQNEVKLDRVHNNRGAGSLQKVYLNDSSF